MLPPSDFDSNKYREKTHTLKPVQQKFITVNLSVDFSP